MKKNQSIEVFIQNPELRESTASEMDADRAINSKLPLVTQLVHLFKCSETPDVTSLKAVIAEYSDQLIEQVVAATITQMGQNPFYVYPMAGHSTYFAQRLSVANTADFDLSLDFIDPVLLKKYKAQSKQNLQQRGISFFGRETLSYFVHAGEMNISHWAHPTCVNHLAGMHCHPGDTQQVNDRHFVHCLNNQTYMYESCDKSAVVVSLEIKRGKLPVSLIFSAADHTLRYQNPSDETDSRLQLCMAILVKLDYVDAIPTLKTFLKHPHHFIRWYAMQQILALDALQVLQELADMAVTDPHPEVKLAAKQTLLIIQKQEFEHAC